MTDFVSEKTSSTASRQILAERIQHLRVERGWNVSLLAEKAEISRTTLHEIEQGRTRSPHLTTLQAVAKALSVEVADLTASESLKNHPRNFSAIPQGIREFNSVTNSSVSDVYEESPGLFSNWTALEWDELSSTFGTGGALTRAGVIATANQINEKRETIQRLHILLDTHLRELSINLIDNLFREIAPVSGLPGNDETLGRSTIPLSFPTQDVS
jgi:transcriptional regulator with XRE-family HTH domain